VNERIQMAAEKLRDAYSGEAVPPLREFVRADDAEGAYAIQAVNTRYWLDQGRRIVGRKVGLTAASVQKQLGVDQPDFGVLFEDMRIKDGDTLSRGGMIQPKAEAEVAVLIGKRIDNVDATADDVAEAVESAVAAIEIVDSRIAQWNISFADTVADNGSSAFFVLGADHKPLTGLDLYSCGMVLEVNGKVASLGAGAACLGHPLNALAWLARTLAAKGEPLMPGDIVLTGALGPMVPLTPGDHVEATIGGLGSVSFSFEGKLNA
jgi:2-keto-4-pentenoate hydratase